MIFWTGRGYLVALFVLVSSLLCNLVSDALWGEGYYAAHQWTIGTAFLIAAIPSWLVGAYLRERGSQVVIDKESGVEFTIDHTNNSLFFVPMHAWGYLLTLFGLVLWIIEFLH